MVGTGLVFRAGLMRLVTTARANRELQLREEQRRLNGLALSHFLDLCFE